MKQQLWWRCVFCMLTALCILRGMRCVVLWRLTIFFAGDAFLSAVTVFISTVAWRAVSRAAGDLQPINCHVGSVLSLTES